MLEVDHSSNFSELQRNGENPGRVFFSLCLERKPMTNNQEQGRIYTLKLNTVHFHSFSSSSAFQSGLLCPVTGSQRRRMAKSTVDSIFKNASCLARKTIQTAWLSFDLPPSCLLSFLVEIKSPNQLVRDWKGETELLFSRYEWLNSSYISNRVSYQTANGAPMSTIIADISNQEYDFLANVTFLLTLFVHQRLST